jgi:hypothetical protein
VSKRNRVVVYSFRTNKFLSQLRATGFDVFVFGKLKDDLVRFQQLVEDAKPSRIVGIAVVKTRSRFETRAVNRFGRRGKVSPAGKASYLLYVPPESMFPRSRRATTSFCNWTAYKTSEFAEPKGIKVSFLHFNDNDISAVIDFLNGLRTPEENS